MGKSWFEISESDLGLQASVRILSGEFAPALEGLTLAAAEKMLIVAALRK